MLHLKRLTRDISKAIVFFLLFFLVFSFGTQASETQKVKQLSIKVGIPFGVLTKYHRYLKKSNNVCETTNPDFDKEQIDRALIDIIIACLALETQGVKLDMLLESFPNNARALFMAKEGKIDTLATLIWQPLISEEFLYSTKAVLQKGEYVKGIYVHYDHPLLTMPADKVQLNEYIGLGMKLWKHDWSILAKLTPNLISSGKNTSFSAMLKHNRADFILMEFPYTPDLTLKIHDVMLKPVPDIKVAFNQSRHYAVSKKSAKGAVYFNLLTKGLAQLRQQGTIKSLYIKSGFINEQVKDWKVIATSDIHPK